MNVRSGERPAIVRCRGGQAQHRRVGRVTCLFFEGID